MAEGPSHGKTSENFKESNRTLRLLQKAVPALPKQTLSDKAPVTNERTASTATVSLNV